MKEHILLLHGALGAKSNLEPLKVKLEDSYTVHSFNFTGHGGEPIPDEMHLPVLVKQLGAYIEQHIPIEPFSIFGYSMGGFAALVYASQQKRDIKKLVTLGTKLNWDREVVAKEVKMLNPETIQTKVPVYAESLQKLHGPGNWKTLLNKTAELMTDLGERQMLTDEVLSKINCSCKLMLGALDKMVTLEETQVVHEKLPNSTLVVLEDTPHPIEKVNPDLLAKELLG